MEEYRLILDKAKSEKMAVENCLDYYMILMDKGVETDVDQLIDLASDYDYDFSNFGELLENYE
jgi:hypothetical protein